METSTALHVIFGTGPLAKSVMRALVADGRRVRMINRSGKADVPAGVEVVAGDAYDTATARRLADGASVVYQCAQPGYTQWATHFPPLQTSILQAVEAVGARFVVGDNLYTYENTHGQPIHERLPVNPPSRKGAVRARMAQEIMDAHAAGRVQAALVRGADFYGPEVLGSAVGDVVFRNLLDGKAAQLGGNVDTRHSYTYIGDFGRAMALVGGRESAMGEVWHVPNAPAVTTRQFAEMAFAEANMPVKLMVASKLMMRGIGLFVPEVREMVEMMYEWDHDYIVDHSKFAAAFGEHYTPLADGIRATVAWYRAHPDAGH